MVGVLGQDMLLGSEWHWSLDLCLVKRLSVNSSTHKAFSYVCAKSILQQAFHLLLCQGRACSLKLNSLFSKWKLKKNHPEGFYGLRKLVTKNFQMSHWFKEIICHTQRDKLYPASMPAEGHFEFQFAIKCHFLEASPGFWIYLVEIDFISSSD